MNWGVITAFASLIPILFAYLDDSLNESVKLRAVNVLRSDKLIRLEQISEFIYQSISGFFSKRALLKSCIISYTVFYLLIILFNIDLVEQSVDFFVRPGARDDTHEISMFILIPLYYIVSPALGLALPDFFSLLLTLIILKKIYFAKSDVKSVVTLIILDFLLTLIISLLNLILIRSNQPIAGQFYGAIIILIIFHRKSRPLWEYIFVYILIGLLMIGGVWFANGFSLSNLKFNTDEVQQSFYLLLSFFRSFGTIKSIDVILFFSTFFTSIWIYAFLIAILAIQLGSRFWNKFKRVFKFFDIEKRPFLAIGMVVSALLLFICSLADLLF